MRGCIYVLMSARRRFTADDDDEDVQNPDSLARLHEQDEQNRTELYAGVREVCVFLPTSQACSLSM